MLSKTTAFVTGGGSGLGAAAVHALLARGASVMVGDLSSEAFEQNILKHVNQSDKVDFCPVDVTQPETITSALDDISSKFQEPLSAVVNSAGIATASKTLNKKGLPHKAADFENVLKVNTVGAFHVARLAAERMQNNPLNDQNLRGCVIQTASIAAYEGQVGQVAYSASKAAIVGMTLPMARDLAPLGIRVMTIVRSSTLTLIVPSDSSSRELHLTPASN